jgi:zinc protease
LGQGKSALLQSQLIEKKRICTRIDAYTTETFDPGLCIINGRLADGMTLEKAEQALVQTLEKASKTTAVELERVKNQMESQLIFERVDLVNRAQELATAAALGTMDLLHQEIDAIRNVSLEEVQTIASLILREENSVTLYYQAVPSHTSAQ